MRSILFMGGPSEFLACEPWLPFHVREQAEVIFLATPHAAAVAEVIKTFGCFGHMDVESLFTPEMCKLMALHGRWFSMEALVSTPGIPFVKELLGDCYEMSLSKMRPQQLIGNLTYEQPASCAFKLASIDNWTMPQNYVVCVPFSNWDGTLGVSFNSGDWAVVDNYCHRYKQFCLTLGPKEIDTPGNCWHMNLSAVLDLAECLELSRRANAYFGVPSPVAVFRAQVKPLNPLHVLGGNVVWDADKEFMFFAACGQLRMQTRITLRE
jgi:hypothetical protein